MAEQTFPEFLREVAETGDVRGGAPLPLGATRQNGGVNFALFSRHATAVRLELFDGAEDAEPANVVNLDPVHNKTGDVWHVWVGGLQSGQLYGYRVEGPYEPALGHRFNPRKLLLDPYAEAVTYEPAWDFKPALGFKVNGAEDSDAEDVGADCAVADYAEDETPSEVDNAGAIPKSVFIQDYFNWEDDQPLKRPLAETIIYETHVRGFTVHESSGVAHPGTYAGLVEKIPYLQDLGITAVELMPVQEFNESEMTRENPETGEVLKNYWGYNPVAFLAPESAYCSHGTVGQQVPAFKQMVKALHSAGIEVIVDIVLNHTAESDRLGPTLCLRGVDNTIFYVLAADKRCYKDYTGTGNTIKADHPVVRDFILNTLRHWVVRMHVDGFRFDLASVLGRDEDGELLADPPLLERIAEDPILRQTKLIAEAWDAGGAYQVGTFAERRWADWNDRFRDDVRRFWRGDAGMVGRLASRIAGSSDVYHEPTKGPEHSINYVTAHDGFTMNDLVSYNRKHNWANGEKNRDGVDENYSANYGVEGPTASDAIAAVRRRQVRNFMLTLFVSRGVPMMLGGDEFRRTQEGNNNAYCQDNEISWYDWDQVEAEAETHRFVKGMIAFRKAHPVLRKAAFYTDEDIAWFDRAGETPAWDDAEARQLACRIYGEDGPDLYLMFNAATEAVRFTLPEGPAWRVAADTGAAPPHDIVLEDEAMAAVEGDVYQVGARSGVILVAG